MSEAGTETTEVDLASKLRISITRSEIYWLHWNPLSIINKFSSVVIFGSKIIKTSRDETINSLIIAVRALSIQFQFESAFFVSHSGYLSTFPSSALCVSARRREMSGFCSEDENFNSLEQ